MTRARNSANLASQGNLFVDIANDRTGIGSVVPAQNLHVAGTAGFHADTTLVGDLYNATWDRSDNSLKFVDNAKAKFGTSNDLEIFHDGTKSVIGDVGTGNLVINGTSIDIFNNDLGGAYAKFISNGAVELYHAGVKKLETTAYGTNTTGTAVNDGLVVAGVATVTTMNVTGVLTYDDVTSVDSVGFITARSGIKDSTLTSGRVVTAGSGGRLQDSADLTFDGSKLHLAANSTAYDAFQVGDGLFIGNTTNNVSAAIFHQGGGADLEIGSQDTITFTTGSTAGNATERLRITSGGLVGIGTDNPTELIDVFSTSNNATIQVRTTGAGAWFEADSASSGYHGLKLSSGGTQRWLVGSFATNNFTIKDGGTSGNERFTIVDGTGNIGINETTPEAKLEVDGRIRVLDNNDATPSTGKGLEISYFNTADHADILSFDRGGSAYKDLHLRGNNLVFKTGTSEKLRITSGGPVGIGTTNPQAQFFNNLVVGNNDTGDKGITIRSNSGNSGILAFSDTDAADANRYDGYISYSHATQHMSFYTALGNKRLNINQHGFVGVNTTLHSIDGMSRYLSVSARNITNGGSAVEIVGNRTGGDQTLGVINFVNNTSNVAQITAKYQGSTTSGSLQFFTSGDERLRIDSAGRVGLNASSPNTELEIQAATDPKIRLQSKESGNKRLELWIDGGEAIGYIAADQSASQLAFRTTGTERLRITSTGNVGIGTNSPDQNLEVFKASGTNLVKVTSQANSTVGLEIEKTGATTQSWRIADGQTVNGALEFYDVTDSKRVMGIDGSGRVIIGSGNHAGGSQLVIKGGDINTYSTLGMFSEHTNPANNTTLSQIRFGSNATAVGAEMRTVADGAWATNDYPTRIEFYTTPDGSNSRQERLRIDSSGMVKIGTSGAPTDILDVHKDSTTTYDPTHDSAQRTHSASITIRNDNGSTNTFSQLVFDTAGSNQSIARIVALRTGAASNALTFVTEHSNTKAERLRITAAGDVGIGVNDPDAKLEVLEDIFVKGSSGDGDTGIQIRSGSSALSNQHQIRTGGGNGNMLFLEAVGNTGLILMKTAGSERLRIKSDGQVKIQSNGSNDTPAKLQLHSEDTSISSGDHIGEIRFTGRDSAGAGTEAVGALIDVTAAADWNTGATGYSPSNIDFHTQSNTGTDTVAAGPRMRIAADGVVAIGTDSPTSGAAGAKLVVHLDDNTAYAGGTNRGNGIFVYNTAAGGHSSLELAQRDAQDTYGSIILNAVDPDASSDYGADFTIQTRRGGDGAYGERLRITSKGQIGVGVDAPTFAAVNSISANAARGIEIFQNGTDTGSAIKLAGDNGSGTKAYSQLGYSGADATTHWANYNTSGTKVGEISITADGVIETGTAVGASGADGNQRFRIGRAGDCNLAIRATGSTTASTGIDFGDSGDDRAGRIQYVHDGNYMSFHTNGAGSGTSNERFRITSTGAINCGHGSAVNLHGSSTTGINLNGNNNSGQIIANASNNRALIIGRQDSFGQVIEFFQGANTNEASITIPAANTFAITTNGDNERLRIDSSGRVGIGTDDPSNANSAAENLVVEGGNNTGLSIISGGASPSGSRIYFGRGYGGSDNRKGQINYVHGDDAFTFHTGTTERVRITSGGNIKLPDDGKIEFGGAQTGSGDLSIYHDGDHGRIENTTGTVSVASSNNHVTLKGTRVNFENAAGTQIMVRASQGAAVELFHDNNKRIETEAGGAKISGNTDGVLNITTTDGRGSFIRLQQSGNTKVWVGSAEGFGSGDQDDGALMAVDRVFLMPGQNVRFTVNSNGNATLVGGLTQNSSDIRLKENIQPITNSVEKVKSLSGFTYNWNKTAQDLGFKGEGHDELQVGLSAQDVEKIQPEVVKPAPVDNNYKTIQYEKLVPLLVEAIKEQQQQIETLQNEINALKSS